MEGKEQRFGIAGSALFVSWGTASGDGAVDSGVESFTGLGAGVAMAMANMMTGEVIFGGPGSGLYGMLLLVVLAVFIAGLMVGRTPEYLGKQIQTREVKLATLGRCSCRCSYWCSQRSPSRPRPAVGRCRPMDRRASPSRRTRTRPRGRTTAPRSPATAGSSNPWPATPRRARDRVRGSRRRMGNDARPVRPDPRRARARGLARPRRIAPPAWARYEPTRLRSSSS